MRRDFTKEVLTHMAETQTAPGFSFAPSAAVEGVSVDFKGTVVASKIGKFTYKDKGDGPQTAHLVVIRNDDEPNARLRTEDWSIGKGGFVSPTNDPPNAKERAHTEEGNYVMRTKDGAPLTGIPKGSIDYQVVEKMVVSGLPEKELGAGADSFVGLQFQWGLGKTKLASGTEADKPRLLPTKFHGRVKVETGIDYFALAHQQREAAKSGVAQPAGSSNAAVAAAPVQEEGPAVDEAFVTGKVIEVIVEAGGSIKKSDLSTKVMGKIEGAKAKSTAVKIVLSEKFLKAIDGVAYDGKELKLA